MPDLKCLKPLLPLPTLPNGALDWSEPMPMCGQPAAYYLDTYGMLPPEKSTTWCEECAKADGLYRWTPLPSN